MGRRRRTGGDELTMGNIADQTPVASLLDPWDNDMLHPNVVEALKVYHAAAATFAHAKRSIDGQYLKSLDGLDADAASQASAVRALMG